MTFNASDHPREDPNHRGRFTPAHTTLPDSGLPATLAGSPIPTAQLEHLHHVGSLDATRKADWSLEGQGLSVSQHPNAWARIARLGGEGSQTWKFADLDDNTFLDYHELTDEQKAAIIAYGVDRGYVEEVTAYKVTTWDEDDEKRWFLTASADEAAEEGEEQEAEIEAVTAYATTALFPDATVKPGNLDADEILAAVWVNEVATDLDGVWWEDDYDPEAYSAPRGVIVPNRIASWVGNAVPAPDVEDLYGDY